MATIRSGHPAIERWWWAGVAGPTAFIGAWIVSGVGARGELSPIDDAISRLAAVGSDVRWIMTTGFVFFGFLVPLFARAVKLSVNRSAAIALSVTALATLGVALTPLDRSEAVDGWHSLFAGLGYLALGAAPVFAWPQLRVDGRRTLGFVGLVAAAIAAVSLPLSLTDYPTGLFQRLGLTAVDLWIIGLALSIRNVSMRDASIRDSPDGSLRFGS